MYLYPSETVISKGSKRVLPRLTSPTSMGEYDRPRPAAERMHAPQC